MNLVGKRRSLGRTVFLDRSLEELPLFRLSDTTDDPTIDYATEDGGRWRVLAGAGERLPGTLDQDVYIELMRRFHEAGEPSDGAISFTLHSFLRSMDRQVDGRGDQSVWRPARSRAGNLRSCRLPRRRR